MYPTSLFRWDDPVAMRALIRERAFATLVAVIDGEVVIAQAPVVVAAPDQLQMHLSLRNRLARALPLRATLIVHGVDGYISPDWYVSEDQVPTWDYVSVEAEGELTELSDEDLVAHLVALSAAHEARIANKPPWTLDKLAPTTLEKKLNGIVGVAFAIGSLHGTAKLSQNKSPADRARVIAALRGSGQHALADAIENA